MSTANEATVSVIIDDFDSSFQFDSIRWLSLNASTTTSARALYMNTIHISAGEDPSLDQLHHVGILFEGTSLAIYGITPRPASAGTTESFGIIIDGGAPYISNDYGDAQQPAYRQWYQSPILSEGTHNITILNVTAGTSIDYAVVTKSKTDLASAQTIIVDDGDLSVKYTGTGWMESTLQFEGSNFTAYGNGTHFTNTTGDSVSYNFTGDSAVNFYGFIDYNAFGNLSISLTMDGDIDVGTVNLRNMASSVPQPRNPQGNVLLFSTPHELSLGSHTLRVDVVQCTGNQTFTLDYITYIPGEVPHKKSSRSGAIAGGILGGLALIFLGLIFLHFVQRRKRQRKMQSRFSYPFRSEVQANPIALQSVTTSKEVIEANR